MIPLRVAETPPPVASKRTQDSTVHKAKTPQVSAMRELHWGASDRIKSKQPNSRLPSRASGKPPRIDVSSSSNAPHQDQRRGQSPPGDPDMDAVDRTGNRSSPTDTGVDVSAIDRSTGLPRIGSPVEYLGEDADLGIGSGVRMVQIGDKAMRKAATPTLGMGRLRRAMTPMSSSTVAPVHSLKDFENEKTHAIASWPAFSQHTHSQSGGATYSGPSKGGGSPRDGSTNRSLGIVTTAGGGEPGALSSDPAALRELHNFKSRELRLVRAGDRAGFMAVYRELFDRVIEKFTTFGPLLAEIRDFYHATMQEMEEKIQEHLLGSKELLLEREKYLAMQQETVNVTDRERKNTEEIRQKLIETERELHATKFELTTRIDELEKENSDMIKMNKMESTVRRESDDNLVTYQKMYHELKSKWNAARDEVVQYKDDIRERLTSLEISERCAIQEAEKLRERLDETIKAKDAKYKQLQKSTVDPERHKVNMDHIKTLQEGIRQLEKKLEWKQKDLDDKSEYEPPIKWEEFGEEYRQLKVVRGMASESIVRVIMNRLNRAQKAAKTYTQQLKNYTVMKEYLSASDFSHVITTAIAKQKKTAADAATQPGGGAGHAAHDAEAERTGSPRGVRDDPDSQMKHHLVSLKATHQPLAAFKLFLSPLVADLGMPPPPGTLSFLYSQQELAQQQNLVPYAIVPRSSPVDRKQIQLLTSHAEPWSLPAWRSPSDRVGELCDFLRPTHGVVKDIFVAAFVALGSMKLASLAHSFDEVIHTLCDFTDKPQFVASLFFAAEELYCGDTFISFILAALRGAPSAKGDGGLLIGSTASTETTTKTAPRPATPADDTATAKPDAPIRDPTAPIFIYATAFVSSYIRVPFASMEKTEKGLTHGNRPTGSLPRRLVSECLQQCLPHKTPRQLIRVKHTLYRMFPFQNGRNVYYRDLWGAFAIGSPSPMLVELADQFIDEIFFFSSLVTHAVHGTAKEDNLNGRITPTVARRAFVSYLPRLLSHLDKRPKAAPGAFDEDASVSRAKELSTGSARASFDDSGAPPRSPVVPEAPFSGNSTGGLSSRKPSALGERMLADQSPSDSMAASPTGRRSSSRSPSIVSGRRNTGSPSPTRAGTPPKKGGRRRKVNVTNSRASPIDFLEPQTTLPEEIIRSVNVGALLRALDPQVQLQRVSASTILTPVPPELIDYWVNSAFQGIEGYRQLAATREMYEYAPMELPRVAIVEDSTRKAGAGGMVAAGAARATRSASQAAQGGGRMSVIGLYKSQSSARLNEMHQTGGDVSSAMHGTVPPAQSLVHQERKEESIRKQRSLRKAQSSSDNVNNQSGLDAGLATSVDNVDAEVSATDTQLAIVVANARAAAHSLRDERLDEEPEMEVEDFLTNLRQLVAILPAPFVVPMVPEEQRELEQTMLNDPVGEAEGAAKEGKKMSVSVSLPK